MIRRIINEPKQKKNSQKERKKEINITRGNNVEVAYFCLYLSLPIFPSVRTYAYHIVYVCNIIMYIWYAFLYFSMHIYHECVYVRASECLCLPSVYPRCTYVVCERRTKPPHSTIIRHTHLFLCLYAFIWFFELRFGNTNMRINSDYIQFDTELVVWFRLLYACCYCCCCYYCCCLFFIYLYDMNARLTLSFTAFVSFSSFLFVLFFINMNPGSE